MKSLMAALVLGGVFGSAAADVVSIDGDTMVIELEVEIEASADAVVAHLSFDNEPELVLPLLNRGGGAFGVVTELEARNYVVVFEILGSESHLSDPASLTSLGADLTGEGNSSNPNQSDDDISKQSRQWLWLALALGAGSLSALAFWVLGGDDRNDDVSEPSGEGSPGYSEEE